MELEGWHVPLASEQAIIVRQLILQQHGYFSNNPLNVILSRKLRSLVLVPCLILSFGRYCAPLIEFKGWHVLLFYCSPGQPILQQHGFFSNNPLNVILWRKLRSLVLVPCLILNSGAIMQYAPDFCGS